MARKAGMPVDPNAPATGNFAPDEAPKKRRTRQPGMPWLPISVALDDEIRDVANRLEQDDGAIRRLLGAHVDRLLLGQVGDAYRKAVDMRLTASASQGPEAT